jgi:undecaprenyl-diphosphatase
VKILSCSGLLLALMIAPVHAADGPLGIDHEWNRDESGIWSRHAQQTAENGVLFMEIGGAFYLGDDDGLGHTLFQSMDASIMSGIAAQGLKLVTERARPTQGNDPDKWRQGHCCNSFPSGEVTLQASFVTPLILHYRSEHPWVWLLEALPLYVSIARLKSQAHWQSDVIAGWALGSGIGYWTSTFKTPMTVQMLPHGMSVGFRKQF